MDETISKYQPAEIKSRLTLRENFLGQTIILTTLALICFGVISAFSALSSVKQTADLAWYQQQSAKHIIFATCAAGLIVSMCYFDYRKLCAGKKLPYLATAFFIFAIILCLLVKFPIIPSIRHHIGGKYRWLKFGNFQIQPSEFLKLALVFCLSSWLSRLKNSVHKFRTFFISGAVVVLSAVLVMKYDMSSAVLIMLAGGVVMLLSGVRWWYLLIAAILAVAVISVYINSDPKRLQRVEAMHNPWDKTNQSSYQAGQSLIAIYSGGWLGKGLGNGTRKLGYLPEDSTDFIFASICEEWGFVGAVALVLLFMAWMWNCRRVAKRAPDKFGMVLAGAFGAMVGMQVLMHMCVNLTLLPPTGIGLPFVSVGGTRLLILSLGVAMVVSVSSRQQTSTQLADGKNLDDEPDEPQPLAEESALQSEEIFQSGTYQPAENEQQADAYFEADQTSDEENFTHCDASPQATCETQNPQNQTDNISKPTN